MPMTTWLSEPYGWYLFAACEFALLAVAFSGLVFLLPLCYEHVFDDNDYKNKNMENK